MALEALLQEMSILCVEDETGIRRRLVNTLRFYFKEVYEACNAQEGFELYLEHKPSLILSDIEMPVSDGIALVKKVRALDVHTPIIMLTAYSNEEYLMQLINLRIQHYIVKPANAQKLLEGIAKACKEKLGESISLSKELVLEIQSRQLFYQHDKIALSKRECAFLQLLAQNRVCTYAMIEEFVWEGASMSLSALKTFVKVLRKKLPLECIKNLPQEGYMLEV